MPRAQELEPSSTAALCRLWPRPDSAAPAGTIDPAHADHGRRAGALFVVLGAPELIASELEVAIPVPTVRVQLQRGAPAAPVVRAVVVLLPDHEPDARLSHTY